jgi:hypothetical protein
MDSLGSISISSVCLPEILLKCFGIFADFVHQADQLPGPCQSDLCAKTGADCGDPQEMAREELVFAQASQMG